ncbi:MAG: hydrogenase formation protein HypD [Desulfurococcaceae archaeon]
MVSLVKLGLEHLFRGNRELVEVILKKIKDTWIKYVEKTGIDRLKIMNFCGTHEYTITHYGIRTLLPNGIELVAGPGCPVCVTPSHYVEEVVRVALDGIAVYTYGDVYRLRTYRGYKGIYSLSEARSRGASVKVVPDLLTAIRDSKEHGKSSLFIGIGFETVAPGYAQAIIRGHIPSNLKIISLVKLTPPAMFYTLEVSREKPTEPLISGVIAPGHVSTVTGAKAWEPVSENYNIPVVVSGFEPVDVLISIYEVLRELLNNESRVLIEYRRAVSYHGDITAQAMISRAFEAVDDAWRGVGFIPKSGLMIRDKHREYDALYEYGMRKLDPSNWQYDMPPGCKCAEIVLGKAYPIQCPLFMKACTPSRPVGPCMVSLEGTCAIWARYGSRELLNKIAKSLSK